MATKPLAMRFLQIGAGRSAAPKGPKGAYYLEILGGESSAAIAGNVNYASAVSIEYRDSVVRLRGNGIYRFDTEPPRLRVYEGEARVQRGAASWSTRGGEWISLDKPRAPQAAKQTSQERTGLLEPAPLGGDCH
jgi:hypothetical protein